MKVINKTHWRTDQLTKLLHEVAKLELDPEKKKNIIVTFKYSRGRHSGYAYIGGQNAVIRVPKAGPVNVVHLAWVIAHEFAHLRGLRHREMRGSKYMWAGRHYFDWAGTYPIEKKPAKEKPKAADVQDVRYKRVLELKKAWQTKLKRAQTAIKKLNAKQKYYERAFAAREGKETENIS